MNSSEAKEEIKLFKEELAIIKTLTPPTETEIASKRVVLGPKTKKYTLILDLDQTLVHAGPIAATGIETHIGKEYIISERPYAKELIESLSPKFEIIVFTSADEEYANQVYDYFNVGGNILAKLLTKSSCIATKEGYLVKDLRIFADRSVNEILIVDDCIISFAFHLANGIPVTPFDGSADDNELYHLINYLKKIYESDDIVKANKEFIGIVNN